MLSFIAMKLMFTKIHARHKSIGIYFLCVISKFLIVNFLDPSRPTFYEIDEVYGVLVGTQ